MNTPPLLLGATLLFWGWQTGFMLPAAAMALVLEGAGLIKARWEFSDDDLSRIWTFCAVLFLAALVYAFSANDGVGNLTGLFQDANLRTQRRAVETGGRTAVAMIRWLPMTLFLFVAAQTYNTRDTVPLATISLILRRRLRRARARGEASPETPAIAVAFPYFAVCLLAACATTERDRTFLPGFCVMVFWALWPYRSRRFGYTAWAGSLVAALVLGFAGQRGIVRLQQFVNSYNPDWFSGLSQRGFDPQQSRTSLGHIGEMKTSGRIVLRLKTPKGQSPPELLREASYRDYRGLSWIAGTNGETFEYVAAQPDGTTRVLVPGGTNRSTVNIACALPGQKALLPLPSGSTRLEGLPDYVLLSTNSNGAVLAEQSGLAIFDAHYGPGQSWDAPADPATDLGVPEREQPGLVRVIEALESRGGDRGATLEAVQKFFGEHFSYSLWQSAPRVAGTNETPLSRFLLETRSGHCEYFATATVLLLRQLGIPARYAVGYAVYEGKGDRYVARQRDAHAWCLVWNEAAGRWEDFDTTPGSWVDEERQRASAFQWVSDAWSRLKFEIARLRWGETNLRRYLLWLLIPVLLFLLYQIVFRRRKRRSDRAGAGLAAGVAWPGLDSEFYRIEQKLAALGFERRPGEAAAHWLERASEGGVPSHLRAGLRGLLTLHYRYRFDPQGLPPDSRESLRSQARACLEKLN